MSLTNLFGKIIGSDNKSDAAVVTPRKTTADRKRELYCRVLDADRERPDRSALNRAWKFLEQDMALVPAGPIRLLHNLVNDSTEIDAEGECHVRIDVESFYIDKTAVTHGDYLQFVRDGGYENLEWWNQGIRSQLLQLVDQSGVQAPRFWNQGKPARDKMDHPVVGICWYEADAYARWAGKQLPDSTQWQRAVTWHVTQKEDQVPPKFPWGDTYESRFANAWSSDKGETVGVREYYDGATPNGVYQLIGNTWELLSNRFEFQNSPKPNTDLVEIRGGAFDTYLESQMNSQFRSGQPILFRGDNVGFRCVSPVNRLHRPD